MKRILVVDDEKNIREVLREYAEFEGYAVEEAEDGMQAINLCKERDYDLIIMDVMMPKIDGFTACKEIRKVKRIPVLMLSARGEEYDKLFGFEMGIDDYVVKPFSPKEVMARVRVIINRNSSGSAREEAYPKMQYDGLLIDTAAHNIFIDGQKIDFTPKEYDLLVYLVKNEGIALSREKLLSDVWGYDYYGDDRTVDTHIKMLRGHLGKYRDYIVTLRGLGYKFEVPGKEQ